MRKNRGELFLIIILISLVITGCSDGLSDEINNDEILADTTMSFWDENGYSEACDIAEVYRDIYEEAVETDSLDSIEVTKRIISRLGENGYIAVDSRNLVDMTESEQVVKFCEAVDNVKDDKITIIVIMELGLCKYDLTTEGGAVNVVKGYYEYDNEGYLFNRSTVSYLADDWQYTEDGYLFFEGSYFTEENYVLTLSDAQEKTAIRILPLEEKCRELNQKYILPIGYEQNNLFLTNWSENDFGELDFYDIFDAFYQVLYKRSVPYAADDNIGVGAVYQIPENEFEDIIMTYLNISKETLRKRAMYFPQDSIYEYRPRGFYEAEYPDIPYPEVVGHAENPDGTITLIINAVYPKSVTSRLFTHKVVIRPLDDDCFQYVSNQIISQESYDFWWHSDRMTVEEWNEIYEYEDGSNSKGYNLSVDETERQEAEIECLEVMNMISVIYRSADKGTASNVVISDETINEIKDTLERSGCSVTDSGLYTSMRNYNAVDKFLKNCILGKGGEAVLYLVRTDGGVTRKKYLFDGEDMYELCTIASWSEEIEPIISSVSFTGIKEWKYTEKGWFCYELCVPEYPEVSEMVDGSNLIRVKPMMKELREISEKYVLGLGYQGNNMLCSNWDSDHLDILDFNGLFEYLYSMKYQKRFNSRIYSDGIPKDEFEDLIMEYIPITKEQIMKYAMFDEENQTYTWVRLGCFNYAPAFFGTSVPEVTKVKDNKDGTITLTVDAVCEMVLCDDAVVTHELTIKVNEDGSFQYIQNRILNGIENIPDYQYRIGRE
ncbi:MAG: hypothetical protein IJ661_06155 [Lachnospiraceae bacterium]|nr:hypothetical protein [Lachnospiraceae bacterium]